MSQVTSKLTAALAGVALASLPVLVGAQQYPTTPQKPSPTRSESQQRSTDQNSPQHHLDEAKKALNSIQNSSLKGDARTQITEIRTHFNQLESAWRKHVASSARTGAASTSHAGGHVGTAATGGTTSGTPSAATAGTTGTPEQAGATGATSRQTPRSGTASPAPSGSANEWMTHYQAIDGLLDRLLGDTSASAGTSSGVSAGATAGTTAGTAGATSPTGTTGGRAGVSAGANVSANVTLDAATRAKLEDFRRHLEQFHATAMSQGRVGEEDAASASAQSGITGSMTQTKPSTATQTPPSTTTTEPTPTTPPAEASVSASASIDSAAIARLSAQIDELLGSASTSSTSATAGAVGTTGAAGATTTTGTVCVDRAKLEQLKRDIQALQNTPRQ
jgi:hypothetical protein